MNLKNIEFGYAAAESEKASAPHLLRNAFLDDIAEVDRFLKKPIFLIVGPKGSGKSAIASRVELLSEGKFFCKSHFLEDFPFGSFSKILPGSEAPEIKFPENWEFLLLLALFDSFCQDTQHTSSGKSSKRELLGALNSLGLSPFPKMAQVVKTATKREFQVALPKVLAIHRISEKESAPANANLLRTALANYVYNSTTGRPHYIFIDGLDGALTRREDQYRSLAALIVAVSRLNHALIGAEVEAKVVVVCRSDLLHRLKDPNLNKIKQDHTLSLEWYQDTTDWEATYLARLINLRAELSLGKPVSVFRDLLPQNVLNHEDTARTILSNTRHLPRDLVQVMNSIQKHSGHATVQKSHVMAGLRTYSLTYFVQEIKDELVGFLSSDEIDGALGLLSALGKRTFTLGDAKKILGSDVRFKAKNLDAIRLLNALYETGAIGNTYVTKNQTGMRYAFKFRNPYSAFDPGAGILVHNGLCKGLNIEF